MNKKAQASVEYLLLLSVVAIMVFSITGIKERIDQRLAVAQFTLASKLAGIGTLTRSDFTSEVPEFSDEEEEGEISDAEIEGESPEDREKRLAGETAKQKARRKAEQAKRASDRARGYDVGVSDAEYDDMSEEEQEALRRRAGAVGMDGRGMYYQIDSRGRKNPITKEEYDEMKELEEDEEGSRKVRIKRDLDDEIYYRKQGISKQQLNFWKIIIIMAVIAFFIIIVMRARKQD